MRLLRPDLHVLAGVYALDGIDDEAESSRFEHHLRRCQQCADEVRGMSATATRLGFAATQPPPAQMRDRVLAAAARTRQLPPAVDHARSSGEPRPRRASTAAIPARRMPRLAWSVVAASLIVIFALTTVLLHTQNELNRATARQAAITKVLEAPDARVVTQRTALGGTATVVYSHARHALILTSAHLPAPPHGKVYELWLLGPPRVRPAGLLPATARGHTSPLLVRGFVPGDQLGMTVEPAGGTSRPTTTPILVLTLRA
ncbi:MAG: anti-sigma factor [Streptosporangiaceae bacterium]